MFKKSYTILKNNLIFIEPILLWMLVFSAILVFSVHRVQLMLPKVIMFASCLLLFIACLAGWLYINKYGLLTYDEKDSPDIASEKTAENLKKFFEGVGKDFIRILLACTVIAVIYICSFYLLYKTCTSYIGIPEFLNKITELSAKTPQEQVLGFIDNISESDKVIFSKWVLVLNFALSILNFFALLYLTVMTFERKNFLLSIFESIKFFIINIFESIGIMIFMFLLYLAINLISVFFGTNSLLFTFLIIIVTMYFNYYVLLVFCFYYDKTKTNSDNRPEFIGENKTCDRTGESE